MLKRISTVLFNHRFIATYVTDKLWQVILFLMFLCALVSLPSIATLSNASLIDPSEKIELAGLLGELEGDMVFKNGELTIEAPCALQTSSYIYSFDAGSVSSKIVFHFGKDKLSIVEYGLIVNSKSYTELGITDFVISNDATSAMVYTMIDMVEQTAQGTLGMMKTILIVVDFFTNILIYLVYLGIFYLIGAKINPLVGGKFRFIIAAYSLTPAFIFDILAKISYLSLFSYIGLVYAVIAYYRALKAIIKIEVKKR